MSANDVYGKEHNPYPAWLAVSTERDATERWLRTNLSQFLISDIQGRPVTVLDIGCGFGEMSKRLIRALKREHLEVDYTGVDPFPAQLEAFRKHIEEGEIAKLTLQSASVDNYALEHPVDLVLASHCLYYAVNMRSALERIITSGREAIIVHQGMRGIKQIREAFAPEVPPGPYALTTDADVAAELEYWRSQGLFAHSTHHRFTSLADVSSCQDPDSERGKDLLHFFLEKPYDILPDTMKQGVREFLRTIAPTDQLAHDVGVFYISHT